MKPPIEGMSVVPYGLPLLRDARLSCCVSMLGQDEAHAAFKEETGHDIGSLVSGSGLDRLIDQVSGRDRTIMISWLNWVTTHVWGVQENV